MRDGGVDSNLVSLIRKGADLLNRRIDEAAKVFVVTDQAKVLDMVPLLLPQNKNRRAACSTLDISESLGAGAVEFLIVSSLSLSPLALYLRESLSSQL